MVEKPKDKDSIEGIGNWDKGRLVTSFYKNILLLDYNISRFFSR